MCLIILYFVIFNTFIEYDVLQNIISNFKNNNNTFKRQTVIFKDIFGIE